MQYKRIDSALHNFGQSFMSGMNYFDDDYVMYEVQRIAINLPGHELRINFMTGAIEPAEAHYKPRLPKSIKHYRARLADHLASHNVEPDCLTDLFLRHIVTNRGHQTIMHATDDRGVEHVVPVRPA